MARFFAICWLSFSLLAACNLDTQEFVCSTNNECPASSGGYGICVARHCAFRSSSCPSGWVFDETGGPVANQCVPSGDLTIDAGAGTPDAAVAPDAGPTPDAGSPDGSVADAAPPDA